MSQDTLMGKFEALMRKHRGEAEAAAAEPFPTERQAPPPDAWLPVLTDVVQRGSPPAAGERLISAAATDTQAAVAGEEGFVPETIEPAPETPVLIESSSEPPAVSESALPQETATTQEEDTQVAARLADELAPKITVLMQEQLAEELRKSLNQSMANLMANLNANVEEIVRQAVAGKLANKDKK